MINIVIAIILIISTMTDLRNRKILNIVTMPAIIGAFIYYFFTSGFEGFIFSGQGFFLGFGLLAIPFLMGGMGAGDVKLLAAVGAWKGAFFIFYTAIYAGIVGGVIALIILLKRGELIFTLKRMLFSIMFWKSTKGSLLGKDNSQELISIPYAIPIALGVSFTFVMDTYL